MVALLWCAGIKRWLISLRCGRTKRGTIESAGLTSTPLRGTPWGVENALGLFSGNYLEIENVSKYKSIGYIELNGFNQNDIDSNNICLIEYAISGLNACIEKVNNEKITGMGIKLYTGISNAINPQSKIIREKTLLIIDKTSERVDFKKMENSGLKHRKISLEEFKKIEESEFNKYAVLLIILLLKLQYIIWRIGYWYIHGIISMLIQVLTIRTWIKL